MAVLIKSVEPNSPADYAQLRGGDHLLAIDGNEINDMLDYEFYSSKAELQLSVLMSGKLEYINLEKEEYEPLGLDFETFLIDKQHSCKNKCMFCFVDQLPKGLRAPLYFKDDDERLSFLFGNYITLTNLSEREVNRIKTMKISPINISVHTMNPELRVKMMSNKSAGKVLSYIGDFAKAGIEMNCQIVLCKGVNDGKELKKSIEKLAALYPLVHSVAVVPAGITRYRSGLAEIEPYDAASAGEVIDIIEEQAEKILKKHSARMVYPADEFFLISQKEMPPLEYYEDMLQLENGVGMWRLFHDEFTEALANVEPLSVKPHTIDVVTGEASASLLKELTETAMQKVPGLHVITHVVRNRFFGGNVWVSGLLTGKDITEQTRGKLVSKTMVLPVNVLRSEQDMLLDGSTPELLTKELGIDVRFCPQNGSAFLEEIMRS